MKKTSAEHKARLSKLRQARWALAHPGLSSKRASAWYWNNRERALQNNKRTCTTWRLKNGRAYKAMRKATELKATPKWANAIAIARIYALARKQTAHDVDHIVPLKHPLVCGLHVEHNLRVIPSSENRSKGNRYWPNMPEAICQAL